MAKQMLTQRPIFNPGDSGEYGSGPTGYEYGSYADDGMGGATFNPYTGNFPVQSEPGNSGGDAGSDSTQYFYDDGQRSDPGYVWSARHGLTPVLQALEASQQGTPLPSGIEQWLNSQAGGATPLDKWSNFVASTQDKEAHGSDMFGINGLDAGTWQGPLMMGSAIAGGFAGAGAGAGTAGAGSLDGIDALGGAEGVGGVGSTGADALAGTDGLGGVEGVGGANPSAGGLQQYADASQYSPTMTDAYYDDSVGPTSSLEDQVRDLGGGNTSVSSSLGNAADWMQNHSVATTMGVGAGLAGLQAINSSRNAERNKQIASDAAARQSARQAITDSPPSYPGINIPPPTRVQDPMQQGQIGQMIQQAPLSGQNLRTYGQGPERRFFNARGGLPANGTPGMTGGLNAMRMVDGHGGGQDDNVPAMLSPTEYVMDAETVSALGDGNPHEGAKKLDKFRERLRAHKRGAPVNKIPPKAKPIESYMGAR